MQPIQMKLSQNQKIFSEFCPAFVKATSASKIIFFWNYRLEKAELLKCQKSRMSEHLWTVNMLKGLKGPNHFLNLHGSIFDTFFDHSETESACKTVF